ncbi:MAG: hypothetical protein ACRDI3_04940 [Actinomycetota bacterium]
MADLWAAPPGATIDRRLRLRGGLRSARGFVASFVVVALVAAGGRFVLTKLQTSDPVSTSQVVQRFRAAPGIAAGDGVAVSTAKKARRPGPAARAQRAQAGKASVARTPPARATEGRAATATKPTLNAYVPPRSGVYTWDTEGYEEAPGLHRELPKESHSIIKRTGAHTWTEHQIYSEQREQWLKLSLSPEGVACTSVRNRVQFGPIEEDNTIPFDPPALFLSFPNEVGKRWGGEWSGKTSGDYQAQTLEKTSMVIGGERVNVWVTEVEMHFRGEVEGESTVRLWAAPEYRMVVKQWQVTDVKSGPGNYHSEWTRVLRSLDPET